jgi:hypothetical protein
MKASPFTNNVRIKSAVFMMGSALGEIADGFEEKDDEFDKEAFINAVEDFAKLPEDLRKILYTLLDDDDEND